MLLKGKKMLLFKSCVPTWNDMCNVTVCFTQCAQKSNTIVLRVMRTLIPWESSVPWSEVCMDWVLICICKGVLTSAENTEIKLPWLALMSSRQRFTSLNLMKRPLIYTVKVHIALASGWGNKPGWSEQPSPCREFLHD